MEDMINIDTLINKSLERTREMFIDTNPFLPRPFEPSRLKKMKTKFNENYKIPKLKCQLLNEKNSENIPRPLLITDGVTTSLTLSSSSPSSTSTSSTTTTSNLSQVNDTNLTPAERTANALTLYHAASETPKSVALITRRAPPKVPQPQWHAPWELSAVVSGHLGWVRSIAFDPSNEWFATGSADRTIKIWDLAKCCAGAEGGLKLTLTGHISAVRGLAVSSRHPYLFSAGEDKMVKCWDLEYNKVVRHYHGHLSGVFDLKIHPTLDLIVTGGRDSCARVWDIRTKHEIHTLGGHSGAVGTIATNAVDPQVITGSHDSTIKLWDLAAGKVMSTLTHHKKAVRNLVVNPREFSFVSASADNIKKWQCRDGKFLKNLSGHDSVVNALAVNEDGVLVSGGDDGTLNFWDYDSGYCFQRTQTIVQPGSLDAEAGIFASTFDLSGSRFITCEADKTIKIWRENTEATEDSHPIDMKGWTKSCLAQKRF
mmetsp:Transcript_12283/g.12683  ORF Transcript_12283/g.12683 Transcript_12283/m.12683 type:complete len:483 (+) Transcript_12283:19-1467(+)